MSAPQVRINGARICPQCVPHVDAAGARWMRQVSDLETERDALRARVLALAERWENPQYPSGADRYHRSLAAELRAAVQGDQP